MVENGNGKFPYRPTPNTENPDRISFSREKNGFGKKSGKIRRIRCRNRLEWFPDWISGSRICSGNYRRKFLFSRPPGKRPNSPRRSTQTPRRAATSVAQTLKPHAALPQVFQLARTPQTLSSHGANPKSSIFGFGSLSQFDILAWWKNQTDEYPILSKIARDLLAVQVSTVASESAFSAGGRVVDPFRSRLDPEMVEALICMKDWVAAERRG